MSTNSATQSRLKVLLVDDDRGFIDAVSRHLQEEYHHETITVYNAIEATKKLESINTGVDIVLVDYEMPGMNGVEFLRWMQQHKNGTPVIMLTAAGSEIVAVEAMKTGAYDYVRKEHLDLNHLGHALYATYERHLFRVAQEFEAERMLEMDLNKQATDKARDVLNTITPPLNTAIANINYELEVKSEEVLLQMSSGTRDKVKTLIDEVLKEVRVLEMSVRGLLTLYRILQAHHAEQHEIEGIRRELEKNLKPQ